MNNKAGHEVFRGDVLDRCGNLRSDPDWLAQRRADGAARYVLLWRYRAPLDGAGFRYFTRSEVEAAQFDAEQAYFLGMHSAGPVFALDVSDAEKDELATRFPGAEFGDLRMSARRIKDDDLAVLGFAKSLLHWQRGHNYCPKCGLPLQARQGGHLLESGECDCKHFPRTDPAVIMVVTCGEHALLGRQAAWPPGVFSALAGFVEPGESAEDAVRREVMEETGVRVGAMQYIASQPWPFPGSLMIGFLGELHDATEKLPTPRVNPQELDDARWFSREELATQVSAQKIILPPPISIARTLISRWYCANGAAPLQSAFD